MDELIVKLRAFAAERNRDQFHSPKSLATVLVIEAAEVLDEIVGGTAMRF